MFSLSLKTEELNALLHRIQIFTNTCEVVMQITRAKGKVILHKLPIYMYYEYNAMCLCLVSTLFGMICLFSRCNKSSTTRLWSLYITIYLCCKCATFVLMWPYSSQCNEDLHWDLPFIGAEKHLWIVFSFKSPLYGRNIADTA